MTPTFLFFSRSACEQIIMITAKAFFMVHLKVFSKETPDSLLSSTLHSALTDEYHAVTGQPNHHITSVVHTICDDPA